MSAILSQFKMRIPVHLPLFSVIMDKCSGQYNIINSSLAKKTTRKKVEEPPVSPEAAAKTVKCDVKKKEGRTLCGPCEFVSFRPCLRSVLVTCTLENSAEKMPACAVVGCSRKQRAGEGVRLFGLPTVIKHHCEKTRELSSKRRAVWLSRINRNLAGKKVNGVTIKVCNRHFITREPSQLFDFTNPDWAPTLHLGYKRKKDAIQASVSRYQRTQARRRKNSTIHPSLPKYQNTNGSEDDALVQCDNIFACTSADLHLEPELGSTSSPQSDVLEVSGCTGTDETTLQQGNFGLEPSASETTHGLTPMERQLGVVESYIIEEASGCTGTDETTLQQGNFGLEPSASETTHGLTPMERQLGVVESYIIEEAGIIPEANEKAENAITLEDFGCQADWEHQELMELQRKYHDSFEHNILLSEQLSSANERLQELQLERDMFSADNTKLREEMRKNEEALKNIMIDEESLQDDDDKTKFFTGIPSFELLKLIYDFVEAEVPHSHRNALPKFTEFLITMMRIRLGILERDLAYRFNVAVSTVSKICSRWFRIMSARLAKLIAWPERNVLRKTVPQSFKEVFGDRFSVIIDCFEVFIDRPSSLSPRAETFSRYKHHNTAKFLIGITPQGSVCFVSEAWGGRASDKHITVNSGFLDKLVPGDVVLADRGFDIDEEVGMRQAKIAIPAFTKGKTQLSFDDIQKTREIANIRIHVERMIGFLRRKFKILGSVIPYSYLVAPVDDDTPHIDHIIKICCGLANLCPSLIRDNAPNGESVNANHPVMQLVFNEDDAGETMVTDVYGD